MKGVSVAKRSQRRQVHLQPAGSRVRPGLRRSLHWALHTGKLPALVLVALAGWGVYDALGSPRYRVRVVGAAGIQALTLQDVAALAAVQDQSIWFVEPATVVERITQSPYVERASARLVLPDRLEVTIAERKPDVRWIHAGTTYAVTWNGLIVDDRPQSVAQETITPTDMLSGTDPSALAAKSAPAGASTVTIVDTTPNRPLKVGDYVDADALELARRVSLRAPAELPAPITRIEWDSGLGLSLIFGEGRQVVLGRSTDLDRKLATLRHLLADGTQFSYLDLRPTTPYYRQ
jgi:cell division protein FtsQ